MASQRDTNEEPRPVGIKRKHSEDNAMGSPRQPRQLPPPEHELFEDNLPTSRASQSGLSSRQPEAEIPPSKDKLTRKNLRIMDNKDQETEPEWESKDSTQASWPSSTNLKYRNEILRRANVFVHRNPPKDIEAAIGLIVNDEHSKERQVELRAIAKSYHLDCIEMVADGSPAESWSLSLREVIHDLGHDRIRLIRDLDWRADLIPKLMSLLPPWKLDRLIMWNRNTSSRAPNQGQEPPAEASDRPLIQTPSPDIAIGIHETVLVSDLILSHNLNRAAACVLLSWLRKTLTPNEQSGKSEPLLVASPTQIWSSLVFPFLVVEIMDEPTGNAFDTQNKNAVTGACGLQIQLALNELADRYKSPHFDVDESQYLPPLFFSISTTGPYNELWVHYTFIRQGQRSFGMKLLKACNGLFRENVDEFFAMVDNVVSWGTSQFRQAVGERLAKVAEMIGTEALLSSSRTSAELEVGKSGHAG